MRQRSRAPSSVQRCYAVEFCRQLAIRDPQADGTGNVERLLGRAKDLIDLHPDGWSKDGKHLLFSEVPRNLECAIGQVAFERPSDVTLLVKGASCSTFARVSPDGRWIAYNSGTPAGRFEIFVERYPELGDRQQISTGGDSPVWSPDGRELFFRSLDGRQMFAVPMQPGTRLVAGVPRCCSNPQCPRPGVAIDRMTLPLMDGS